MIGLHIELVATNINISLLDGLSITAASRTFPTCRDTNEATC